MLQYALLVIDERCQYIALMRKRCVINGFSMGIILLFEELKTVHQIAKKRAVFISMDFHVMTFMC